MRPCWNHISEFENSFYVVFERPILYRITRFQPTKKNSPSIKARFFFNINRNANRTVFFRLNTNKSKDKGRPNEHICFLRMTDAREVFLYFGDAFAERANLTTTSRRLIFLQNSLNKKNKPKVEFVPLSWIRGPKLRWFWREENVRFTPED